MRARYYEVNCGRFVSEDKVCDGLNWFTYCCNDPINFSDESGCYKVINTMGWAVCIAAGLACMMGAYVSSNPGAKLNFLIGSTIAFALAFTSCTDVGKCTTFLQKVVMQSPAILRCLMGIATGLELAKNGSGIQRIVLLSTCAYSLVLLGLLLPVDDYGDEEG